MKQTRFPFDRPVTSDWLFWVFVVLTALNGINAVQRVNESGGVNTPTFSLLSGTINALVGILSTFILVIPIYLVRKFIRKRNKVDAESAEELFQVENDDTGVESLDVPRIRSKKLFIFVGATVLVLTLIISISGKSLSAGDRYFEIEQSISAVVSDWNVAATPLAEMIRSISDGSMGTAEATRIAGKASSEFAVISNRLDDACGSIPEYDVNAPGFEGALAKSYDALQVTCHLLPQESTEVLLLFHEKISPIGTQANIDYHSNEIVLLIEKRKQAILDSIDAMMPYFSKAQKENLERMRVLFTR